MLEAIKVFEPGKSECYLSTTQGWEFLISCKFCTPLLINAFVMKELCKRIFKSPLVFIRLLNDLEIISIISNAAFIAMPTTASSFSFVKLNDESYS